MRPLFVAVTTAAALLALTGPGTAADGAKKTLKKTPPNVKRNVFASFPELGDGAAKGVIVAVDDKNKSFDLRTAKGVVRVKYDSLTFVDRLGATLAGMTPQKSKEECYMTITLQDGFSPQTGRFRYLIIVEALP